MKRVYIDMDNVLADFKSGIAQLDEQTRKDYEGHWEDVPGICAKLNPMPGAIEAVNQLKNHFDLYILSAGAWNNPTTWGDKLNWVKEYFGGKKDDVFYKRLILTHHKDLCMGDFLIDDRPTKNGVDKFQGEVIHFGSTEFPDWPSVVKYLMNMQD